MVARRKPRKDEHELPPAAHDNPYALLSREELAAALAEIDAALAVLPAGAAPERKLLEEKRSQVVQGDAWRMVRQGIGTWNGGQPRGSDDPVDVVPGPYLSDYVIEDRR